LEVIKSGIRQADIGFLFRKAKMARQKGIKWNSFCCNMRWKMASHDPFDGYTVNVFQDEDGDYLAHFVELPNISAFAGSPEMAIQELATAWGGVKESYMQRGDPIPQAPDRKEYNDQVNIRMDRHLHRALAKEAAISGVSLDVLVARKLAKSATGVFPD
jgi:predicted HicB family RNase H-like nuclease